MVKIKKGEPYVWVWHPDLQRLVKTPERIVAHTVEGVETNKPLVDEGEERVK